jgi:hypothetical protein
MSTKTTFKRVALVTVAALGFGVLTSVSPVSAATAGAKINTVATLTTTTTTLSARVNNQVQFDVTATLAATVGSTAAFPVARVAAAITEQPASSAVYTTLLSSGSALNTRLRYAVSGGSAFAGTTAATAAVLHTQTSADPAEIKYLGADDDDSIAALATNSAIGTVRFTPTHVGTYKIVVWGENTTTGAASLSGADSYQTFTVIVSAGVSTITLTPWNATSVEDSAYGSLVKITLKDAAGNAAALASGESISVLSTGTGRTAWTAAGTTGTPASAAGVAGAAWSLSSADFSSGVAYVNIINAAAETVALTATLSSSDAVTASTALTFKSRTAGALAATIAPKSTTTGYNGSSTTYTVPQVSSVTFANSVATGSAATTTYWGVDVTDTSGKITGKTLGIYGQAVGAGGTFTVSATFGASGSYQVDTAIDVTTGASGTPATFTMGARTVVGTPTGLQATNVAVNNASLRIAPASSASFVVSVVDLFGDVLPNVPVVMSWTGRNASTASTQKTGLTDADGQVTLAYTDSALSTVTATADTVTFTVTDGSANTDTATATINWVTTVVGTVVLTSTGDTDTIAGTTKTDISATSTGATDTAATASALVKDANGVIIVGTPVTFVVTGLVGAEVHTTTATVYTDSTGTAVGSISSYAEGKATVTATAGTITATDDLYFSQQTLTEARTISAVASGNNVVVTVKDRYGNTIEGVTVNATRVGTGFFGTGASTATGVTNASGVIEFQYNGAGTVTVGFSTTTYGQSCAAAGKTSCAATATAITASAAGTVSANQTGLGASLAPAGVNSVAVALEAAANVAADNAQAATDAAAEATDAANAATDAANAAAEAADAATAAAQDAADAVAALSAQVATLISGLKAQLTALTNLVIKIQKKVKA